MLFWLFKTASSFRWYLDRSEKAALRIVPLTFFLGPQLGSRTIPEAPRHFEPLIRAHFHAKAPKILRVCRAYLEEGCPIGQYDARLSVGEDAKTGGSGTTGKADAAAAAEPEAFSRDASGEASGVSGASDECSGSEKKAPSRPPPTEGFKLTLRKLVPRLEAAFKANDELFEKDASERSETART